MPHISSGAEGLTLYHYGPAAGEPHGTAAREIPALLEPAWQGDGCPYI